MADKLDVKRYEKEIKASLDDMKLLVDDLVVAEEDGSVSTSEALTIALTHIITNLGIWSDFLPFIGKK